jgi:ligand-binding SRPBCC domain-containing protein
MKQTIKLRHIYPYPADLVWKVATDLDLLKRVVAGKVEFRNLPSGAIFSGQDIKVDVSLFGVLPYQPYRMQVVSLDVEQMCFVSSEKGAGVKSWQHSLRVVANGQGAAIEEEIEIDAGLLTRLFCKWAQFLYKGRHRPRLEILEEMSQSTLVADA